MAIVLAIFMSIWCRRENARRDAAAAAALASTGDDGGAELTTEQKLEERERADDVPWFRFSY